MPIKFAIINVSFDLLVKRLHDLFVLLSQWTMWYTCVKLSTGMLYVHCTILFIYTGHWTFYSATLDTGHFVHLHETPVLMVIKLSKFCTRTQKLSNQNVQTRTQTFYDQYEYEFCTPNSKNILDTGFWLAFLSSTNTHTCSKVLWSICQVPMSHKTFEYEFVLLLLK